MARIPETEIERLKSEVGIERLMPSGSRSARSEAEAHSHS